METRANYMLIGLFTLLSFLGLMLFVLWTAKLNRVALMEYDIYFEEKVSGLAVNSDVLFNGIRVGSVTQLKLSSVNPKAVRARIAIAEDTPVRADSLATLENKGLTGVVLISLAGGSADATLNIPAPGKVGEIKYQPSPMAAVLANMPGTLELANQLLFRLNILVSDDNREAVGKILNDLAAVSDVLKRKTQSLDAMLGNFEVITKQMQKFSAELNELLQKDGEKAVKSFSKVLQAADGLLKKIEPGLSRLSREGVIDLQLFFNEARNFLHVYTRVGRQLENDPLLFLLGRQVQEYKAP